ncbi:MAG: ABC transporter ATP-binding protein [Clostridium sp.]|nr:ABC transporter ATP-binding protein [Clostridium sp.]
MEKYYFQARRLCVGYQEKPLIRDIEIGLDRGEILTVIGPNGAGKSTLLKSIAGQLSPLAGTVYLDKKDLSQMSGRELSREMAVVFTERMRTELMTCEEAAATGRHPYTGYFGVLSKADNEIVEEAMRLVHVWEIRRQDFNRISDGQRQRVMLARAICQEPEIILMDEPVSYLDIKHKLEFLSVLQELREKKGLTIIMSLHELELAKIISDKILCLKGEYVERWGPPQEIFQGDFIERLFDISEENFSGNEKLLAYVKRLEG